MGKKPIQEQLFDLLDLLEEYEDALEYGSLYKPFRRVVSRNKVALLDTDDEEAEIIRIIRGLIRTMVNTGIKLLKEVKEEIPTDETSEVDEDNVPVEEINPVEVKSIEKTEELSKGFSYNEFARWHRKLSKEIPKIERDFYNKLIMPVSVSYGKGFERAMGDLGVKPNRNWMYMPGHSVERLTALNLLQHINEDLSMEMRGAVVNGMRAGENPNKIARRLRKVHDKPKHIKVKPLVDPKTGKVLRKGFEYDMSSKRYSEVVARTEVNRATNHGRLDGYKRSGVVKDVEVLTAGDKRVCELCEDKDRNIYSLEEARAIIPVHASCRCTWTVHTYVGDEPKPADVKEDYEVSDGEKFYTKSFTGLPKTKPEMKQQIDAFKKQYKGLSKLEQHNVRLNAIRPLRQMGYAAKYDQKNISDIASLVYHSKNMKYAIQKEPNLARVLMRGRKDEYSPLYVGRNWLRKTKGKLESSEQTWNAITNMGGKEVVGMASPWNRRMYVRGLDDMQSYITTAKLSKHDIALQYYKQLTGPTHELGHVVYTGSSAKKQKEWSKLILSEHKKNKAVSTYERKFYREVFHKNTFREVNEAFAESTRIRIWAPNKFKKFEARSKLMDKFIK